MPTEPGLRLFFIGLQHCLDYFSLCCKFNYMERESLGKIVKDLGDKIVFLVGPRQVGKTWLARRTARDFKSPTYLNYDSFDHRAVIRDRSWFRGTDLLILDEIHKMPDWKNYLKGVFDTKPEDLSILVTGSARLDAQKHSGDSLAGRFRVHRLMPVTHWELSRTSGRRDEWTLDRLLQRGGFPEPFLADDPTEADRWRVEYVDSIVRFDAPELDRIHEIRKMQLLVDMLRRRVGSPVSFSGLAQDLSISPNTVSRYVEILESLFLVFRVPPFAREVARAIRKTPKIYFYDVGLVAGDEGTRQENLAALELLGHCLRERDRLGRLLSLQYLRTRNGQEVDFALVKDGTVQAAIEVKSRETRPSSGLKYFSDRYGFPGSQVVFDKIEPRSYGAIDVVPAESYFASLDRPS